MLTIGPCLGGFILMDLNPDGTGSTLVKAGTVNELIEQLPNGAPVYNVTGQRIRYCLECKKIKLDVDDLMMCDECFERRVSVA